MTNIEVTEMERGDVLILETDQLLWASERVALEAQGRYILERIGTGQSTGVVLERGVKLRILRPTWFYDDPALRLVDMVLTNEQAEGGAS